MSQTALIVDDDRLIRAQIRDALGSRFTLFEAADGEEALEIAAREKPDLVLLDLFMPRLSGLETLPRLLALHPSARVVVVSSLGVDALVAQATESGARGFLIKPFHPMELDAAIDDALS